MIKDHFDTFCEENQLNILLSYDMPDGYETAFGTFDVVKNTLFLNNSLLQSRPPYEALFYLYHELRHAQQYLKPELFPKEIQESLFYVLLYNGVCYKLAPSGWKECTLEGTEEYFTHAYLSLPYELDANAFAKEKVASILGNSPQLQELASFYLPPEPLSYEELQKIFDRIDKALVAILARRTIMKILVLNGPNLNLLGLREPEIYGKKNYAALEEFIRQSGKELGCEVEVRQSNHEGVLVDWIQEAYGKFDGIVINPAAYTHTSVAILDALKAVQLPAVEVHLSDVSTRENFRQISYARLACQKTFMGLGFGGYRKALEFLKKNVEII